MPRIYTSDSEPLDFCFKCFPSEKVADQRFGHNGDGPDGRGNCFGWDASHPDYDEANEYECYTCRKRLGRKDEQNRHYRPKEYDAVAESIASDRRTLPGWVSATDYL